MKRVICLIGVVCGVIAHAAEPTPADYARLNRALDRYHRGRVDTSTDWGVPGSWRVHGYDAAAMVLGHVLKHADDIGEDAARRAMDLLGWSLELVHGAEAEPAPFVRRLVRARLNALFKAYRGAPRRLDAIAALLDATDLWSSAQVRFLAERAGDYDETSARFHAEVLMRLTPWTDADARLIANAIRRRPAPLRSLAQRGLLTLTGLANQVENARLLVDAADAFASVPPPPAWTDDAHPVRAAVDFLFDAYDPAGGPAHDVFARARALSAIPGERHTSRALRRRFFTDLHRDRTGGESPADAGALVVERRIYARARPTHPRRGNVYYPAFGPRRCSAWLTSAAGGS